ncbi:hypothetical protein Tco_0693089, partial [Tanacetum coccineum]
MLDWGGDETGGHVERYATASVDLKWRYAPPSGGYDLHRRHSSPSFGMLLPPKDMIYSEGMLFHPLLRDEEATTISKGGEAEPYLRSLSTLRETLKHQLSYEKNGDITHNYCEQWQSITSLKCVLTQEHLNAICAKYFVPEEIHPQLPSPDATMHERPTGKVGMYTRFFDYANYRIPFSTFFVSVLTHFRIPFSQLSVFGSAKVSHFEILCRVCNIEPDVSLFRYFYTHNYKNGWFGFTKRPNVRACYSKNLDSVKNWNDHFFWVDEFVVPANARFSWFSGSNIVKDRAPAPSEYNVEHVNTLIAQASPFLRFPEEFLCWVGISRNYLFIRDAYPRFVVIVERARAENERPIVTVAKHHTVTLLPTFVVRSSGELLASVEREFVGDASVGDGGDQGFDSVGGQD